MCLPGIENRSAEGRRAWQSQVSPLMRITIPVEVGDFTTQGVRNTYRCCRTNPPTGPRKTCALSRAYVPKHRRLRGVESRTLRDCLIARPAASLGVAHLTESIPLDSLRFLAAAAFVPSSSSQCSRRPGGWSRPTWATCGASVQVVTLLHTSASRLANTPPACPGDSVGSCDAADERTRHRRAHRAPAPPEILPGS